MANPKIQLRHDTAANWTSANPVLLEGEIAVTIDNPKINSDHLENVNNVTISDGIASGFSSTTYLKFTPLPTDLSLFQVSVTFTTTDNIDTHQHIFALQNVMDLSVELGSLKSWNYGSDSAVTVMTVEPNTTYDISVTYVGTSGVNSKTVTNNTTKQDLITFNDTGVEVGADYEFRFGLSSFNTSTPFLGTLDLLNSYVNTVNNGVIKLATGDSKFKIGDGKRNWRNLDYQNADVSTEPPSNMVTTDTEQTITGAKTINELTVKQISRATTSGQYKLYDTSMNSTLSGLGMPDSTKATVLTSGTSGTTYTAPANGWFLVDGIDSAGLGVNNFIVLRNITTRLGASSFVDSTTTCGYINCVVPVLANDTVAMYYQGALTPANLTVKFIYAKGEEVAS